MLDKKKRSVLKKVFKYSSALPFVASANVDPNFSGNADRNEQSNSTTNNSAQQHFVYTKKSSRHIPGPAIGTGSTTNPIEIVLNNDTGVTLEDIDPEAGQGNDDTRAFYEAIDKSIQHRTRVQLLGKTYNFDQPIRVDKNKEALLIEGMGSESKRFDPPPYSVGSVLNSRITTGDAFSFRGVQSQIRDMTLAGVTNDWILVTELYQFTSVENVHIDAAGPNTNGLRADISFTNTFKNIDIYKRQKNKQGIGFWHNTTTDIAGGNTLFENITASYFKHNLEFGQEAAFGGNQKRRNNTLINLQGRYGNTGIRFGAGYGRTEVTNAWTEWNDYAQIQVHSGAGPIWFRGCEMAAVHRGHGLVLGIDPSTGINEAIYPITMQNAQARAWKNFAAIRIFPPKKKNFSDLWHEFDLVEFWNNGGGRIVTERTDQLPILIKRPIINDTNGHWNSSNFVQVPHGSKLKKYPNSKSNPVRFQKLVGE